MIREPLRISHTETGSILCMPDLDNDLVLLRVGDQEIVGIEPNAALAVAHALLQAVVEVSRNERERRARGAERADGSVQ